MIPARAHGALASKSLKSLSTDARGLLQSVGHYAPIFGPRNFSKDLFPGLPDVLDPAALAAAGWDGDAPCAVYSFSAGIYFTAGVKDPKALGPILDAWLARRGKAEKKRGVHIAVREEKLEKSYSAYWMGKGRAVVYLGDEDEADVLEGVLAGAGLPRGGSTLAEAGAVWRSLGEGDHLALTNELGLRFVGKIHIGDTGVAVRGLATGSAFKGPLVPYAVADETSDVGWLVSRLPVTPGTSLHTNLLALVDSLVVSTCPKCDAHAFGRALGDAVAGPFAARIVSLDLGALKQENPFADALDMTRFVMTAQLRPGVEPVKIMEKLARPLGQKADPRNPASRIDGTIGKVRISAGGSGRELWLTNQGGAPAVPEGKPGPAVEGVLRLDRIAKAFEPFGVGDLPGGGVRAGLATVRIEVAPLLKHSGPLSFRADLRQDGQLDVDLRWPVEKPTPPAEPAVGPAPEAPPPGPATP